MKKLIALISATAIMLSTALCVSAAKPVDSGISMIYNPELSSATAVVYDVYLKKAATDGIGSLNVAWTVPDKTMYSSAEIVADYTTAGNLVKTSYAATSGRFSVTMGIQSAPVELTTSDGKMVTVKCNVATGKTLVPATNTISAVNCKLFINGAATTTTINIKNGVEGYSYVMDDVKVASAELSGTTVNEDAASDPATYFSTEANLTSGATAFWYANIGGDNKKAAATLPDTDGNVTLGLVFTGTASISDVKLVVE